MKIVCITIAWNEEELLPVFLKHYEQFCDKIIVYDNESDDLTPEICDAHPLVERRIYQTNGEIRDDVYLQIKNSAWKDYREYDWVCVLDLDEFVYHPNIKEHLELCKLRGISIPQTTGWSMWSDAMPTVDIPIWEQITKGLRDTWYDKTPIFDPKLLEDINYKHGCHACFPSGSIVYDKYPEMKLLHCKNIGGIDRLEHRRMLYEARLSDVNKQNKWGHNYELPCRIKEEWEKHMHFSHEIISL